MYIQNNTKEVASKEKFYVTVEIEQGLKPRNEQYPLFVDKGKVPNLGDFVHLFREQLKVDLEIRDFGRMEFKPPLTADTDIRVVRVTRTERDYTYKPVTKI